jgi:cell division protein FtsB
MAVFYRDRQDRLLKLVLAVLLLVLLVLQVRLWSGAGSLAEINRLDGEISVQQADNALLGERNEALRQEVNDLKNGLDSIEERARSQLGLVRKGETFILVVDREDAKPALDATGNDTDGGNTISASAAATAEVDAAMASGLDTLPPPLASDERPAVPVATDPAL